MTTVAPIVANPGSLAVDGDTVRVGDWSSPRVARLHAVGAPRPRSISLPVLGSASRRYAPEVWTVAAGAAHVWATTPRDGALWRIDPKTNAVTRVDVPQLQAVVAADADDGWVSVQRG